MYCNSSYSMIQIKIQLQFSLSSYVRICIVMPGGRIPAHSTGKQGIWAGNYEELQLTPEDYE